MKSITKKKVAVFAVAALTHSIACSGEELEPEPAQTIFPTDLPSKPDTINCEATPQAPTFCDWIASTDAVVWGELVDVRMQQFPAATATSERDVVSECDGPADAALVLELRVKQIYHGSPPETVTIVLGHHQLDEMSPRPALHPQEGLVWIGDEPKLEVGDHIGVALHQSPLGDMWGLLGESLFADDEDGRLITQDHTPCYEPPPEGVAGLTRAELSDAVVACPTQASSEAEVRSGKLGSSWENPSWSYAGLCHSNSEDL